MREPAEVITELNSWDSVADELHKRGITGTRDNCEACPIATYLCNETGWHTEVDTLGVTFRDPDDPDHVEVFNLSVEASRFILRFDDGMYPDLDDQPMNFKFDPDEY